MRQKGISTVGVVMTTVAIVVAAIGAVFLLRGAQAAGPEATFITCLIDNTGKITFNGGTTTERQQIIQGSWIRNPGAGAGFNGRVYLSFNDLEREIPVYDDGLSEHGDETANDGKWSYREKVVLQKGWNTFYIRSVGDAGNTADRGEEFRVYAETPPMDIWVELTWNTNNTDLDLHVRDPDNRWTYYSQMTEAEAGIPDAQLHFDDVDGYGPEYFTMQRAESSYIIKPPYSVKVRYYSHGDNEDTVATVRISIAEGPKQTFTRTFTYDQAGGDNPSSDWLVAKLSMTGEGGGTLITNV